MTELFVRGVFCYVTFGLIFALRIQKPGLDICVTYTKTWF
jgi:hypothetical protein